MVNRMKYIIFGAGMYGEQAIHFLKQDDIEFFIDNNIEKQKESYFGYPVLSLESAKTKIGTSQIVIAISDKYVNQIEQQLNENGITNYKTLAQLKFEITREKLLKRTDYISVYNKAVSWILNNSVAGKGIINNTKLAEAYPEVTGYYIPTLIRWGYKELAISYAKWLCSIQHEDGAWYDTEGKNPYIFDSAQILKGLIAVRDLYKDVDDHIIKGCDWVLSNMDEEGRLVSPLKDAWGDGKTFSELIHTYCISPIKQAGVIFDRQDYIDKAEKIAKYYTTKCKKQILNFDLLSHFYAYVMEAMLDIGEVDLAKEAMAKIADIQKESGAVPAYNNVHWVCSTGLFQLALVWFRLGDIENGNKAFEYACKLQNESGGWYGSYLSEDNSNEINTYFPDAEISWGIKYFLDALYYKNLAQFEIQAPIFSNTIDKADGRYKCIKNVVESISTNRNAKVLDMGCGKGRYLKNLVNEFPNNKYFASDLSIKVMKFFDLDMVEKRQGNLTNIPYADSSFDVVYTCEALEHAIDIKSAIKELCRVTKPGGKVAIVDKNKEMLGYFEIEEWEQWFDEKELRSELMNYCSEVQVIKNIDFDNTSANGLFYCWIGKIKG